MSGPSEPSQTPVGAVASVGSVHQVNGANQPRYLEDDFEAEANAMVDSLVGLDDEDEFLRPGPMTPPSHSSTSPLNIGGHLLGVRSYSQSGQTPVSPAHRPSLLNGLGQHPSRPLRSPSTGHQLPQSPNVYPGSLAWGAPQPQQLYQSDSRPGTASQQTPLVPPGLGRHSRINSAEAVPSSPWIPDNGLASPWIPDNTWSTFAPTDGQSTMRSNRQSLLDRNLGNGTFGEMFPRRESQIGRNGSLRGSPVVATGDGWGTPERASFGPIASPFYDRQMSFSGLPTTPASNPVASIGSGRPKPIK